MKVDPAVRQANQEIRAAYKQGCRFLKELTARIAHGTMREYAARQGISAERIRKLRQIAEVYTPQQIEELLRLCEQYGRGIGVSYLFKLVSVPTERRQRYNLQIEMLREGWSRGELDRRIVAKFGRRNNAGKRKTIPRDLLGLISQIESESTLWGRWQDDIQDRIDEFNHDNLAGLFEQMAKATREVKKLQTVSAGRLKRLREK